MIYILSNNNMHTSKKLEDKNLNKGSIIFNDLKSLISGLEDQNNKLLTLEDNCDEKNSIILRHLQDKYGDDYVNLAFNNNNEKYKCKILKLFKCDSALRNDDKIQATRHTQSKLDNQNLRKLEQVSYNVFYNGYPQLVEDIIYNLSSNVVDIINCNGYNVVQNCVVRNMGNNSLSAVSCEKQVQEICANILSCLLKKSILEQVPISKFNLGDLYCTFMKNLEKEELYSVFAPELPRVLFDFINLHGDKILVQVYKHLKKYKRFKDECNKCNNMSSQKANNQTSNLSNNDLDLNNTQLRNISNDLLNANDNQEGTVEISKTRNSYTQLKKKILDKIKHQGFRTVKNRPSSYNTEEIDANKLDENNNLNDEALGIQNLLSNLTAATTASLIIHTD